MSISTSIQREAPEIEKIRLQLLEAAKAQTEAPMTLPGYRVAGLSPEQVGAMQLGVQGIGAFMPYMQQGTQGLQGGMGVAAKAAGQFLDSSINQMPSAFSAMGNQAPASMGQGIGSLPPAMGTVDPTTGQMMVNPYQQHVIDASLRQIQRQGDISRQNLQAQAVRSGAFGGSREGVQRAEMERNMNEQRNSAIVNALNQGFEANQSRAMQGANMLANMGVQQGTMGRQLQELNQGDTNFMFGLGAIQQKQAQAVLDAERATGMQNAMRPMQNIAFLSDIYRGAPSTQMSLIQQSNPSPSPFQQITGLATGMIGTAAAAKNVFGGGTNTSSI